MAKKRVGWYPKEFRRMAVERLKNCDNIVALAHELGVNRRPKGHLAALGREEQSVC